MKSLTSFTFYLTFEQQLSKVQKILKGLPDPKLLIWLNPILIFRFRIWLNPSPKHRICPNPSLNLWFGRSLIKTIGIVKLLCFKNKLKVNVP